MAIELYSKATLDTLLAAKLADAPIDGSTYGRKDGAWEIIPPSGSATWGAITGTVTDQTDLVSYVTGLGYITGIAWGSITGTVTSQSDLTSYLGSNYYPLSSNPAGYLTSAPGKSVNNVDMDTGDYTLVITDANNIINVQGDGSNWTPNHGIYIPADSSVAFPIGTEVLFTSFGGGYNYINGASGVTVYQASSGITGTVMRKAVKLDTDTWLISSSI